MQAAKLKVKVTHPWFSFLPACRVKTDKSPPTFIIDPPTCRGSLELQFHFLSLSISVLEAELFVFLYKQKTGISPVVYVFLVIK